MMMDEELKKLSWFLKGPFFTVVPPPSPDESGQEFVDYLNANNLTIISFDVVSNLRKQLDAKEKEWEEEREEMKKEMKRLEIRKDLCMANQTKLVNCVRKIGELSGFKESFGSEESKCVLVGQGTLDRFYDHVKSTFEKVSPSQKSQSSSSSPEPTTSAKWDDEEKRKVKKARKSQEMASPPTQPVTKPIKRKIDRVLPPLPPRPPSFDKSSLHCSSSLSSNVSTKWGCGRCGGRCESVEEYIDHSRILRQLLPQLRGHGQHVSELGSRIFFHQSRVQFLTPPNQLVPSRPVSPRSQFLKESIEEDDDDDSGKDLIAESVSCSVCGNSFGDMAKLNFHLKMKHDGRGGPMAKLKR